MAVPIEVQRRSVARHGISLSQKHWLVAVHQKGECPICLKPLSVEEAAIDHAHNCAMRFSHKRCGSDDYGCPLCIRGGLHRWCNAKILYSLEQHPHLASDYVKSYLARRPFFIKTKTEEE